MFFIFFHSHFADKLLAVINGPWKQWERNVARMWAAVSLGGVTERSVTSQKTAAKEAILPVNRFVFRNWIWSHDHIMGSFRPGYLGEKNWHNQSIAWGRVKLKINITRVFKIDQVAQRRGQFQQLLKTQVILILNFTRIYCDYLLIEQFSNDRRK